MGHEWLVARLHAWASWFNAGGCWVDGGWPVKNVLHPAWMPPSCSTSPTWPAGRRADTDERQVHAAIAKLSDKLIAALVARYCRNLSGRELADAMSCSEVAAAGRLHRAHDQLGAALIRLRG